MKISILKNLTIVSASLLLFLLQGCSQFETPLEIPETGTIQVITTSDAKCTLYRSNNLMMEWTGSKIISGMTAGSYRVTITSDKFNSSFEESFELGVSQRKNLEIGTGALDIRIKSNFSWEVLKDDKSILSGKGSSKVDTLWTGDYTVKIKVNPALPEYVTIFTITKQQTKAIEPLLGSFTIETKSDYQNTLLLEGKEQLTWTGTKEFSPFVAGNYILKSKMFTNSVAIEQAFIILPNENKTIEWEYGNINVTAPGSTCKLKREEIEQVVWQGNNTFDSLITGNYSVEIQEANSPLWTEHFTLTKDEQKNSAISYASIQMTSNVQASVTKLIYNGNTIKTLTGSGTILNIVPGSCTITIEASGYTSQTHSITLSNGQTLQKNVQLVQPLTPMIIIPGGTFTMGCTSEQNGCNGDETPTHQVTLSSYEIGKYEVTQKEWRTVVGTSPSYFTGDNKPVENVSWNDIIIFCNTLSTREGLTPVYTVNGSSVSADWNANGYRLPTEAEWEYAARGGASTTNTQYSGSNTIGNVAWYFDNSGSTTHDLGTKSPNQLGIYDISGNVWEWCWDWYLSSYYTSSSQTNPKGPISGSNRVLRGGGWDGGAVGCRVADRVGSSPVGRSSSVGFRLARTK